MQNASAGLLTLGFMTPIVAILITLGSVAIVFTNAHLVQVTILAAAIAFLGPGAFSIDARLFGRREILIRKTLPNLANPNLAARRFAAVE